MSDSTPTDKGKTAQPETDPVERIRSQSSGGQKSKSGQTSSGGQKKSGSGKRSPYVKKDELRTVVGFTGTALWFIDGSGYDSQRVADKTDAIVEALDKMQHENEAFRRALQALITTSTYGMLASALMPVIVPILANHKIVPAQTAVMVGAPPPPWALQADGNGNGQTANFGSPVTDLLNGPDRSASPEDGLG